MERDPAQPWRPAGVESVLLAALPASLRRTDEGLALAIWIADIGEALLAQGRGL